MSLKECYRKGNIHVGKKKKLKKQNKTKPPSCCYERPQHQQSCLRTVTNWHCALKMHVSYHCSDEFTVHVNHVVKEEVHSLGSTGGCFGY